MEGRKNSHLTPLTIDARATKDAIVDAATPHTSYPVAGERTSSHVRP
jgi:hypothetical protein